jgi:hypothetical protein
MALDKLTVALIQKDIQAALKAVADKHNLSMSGSRISYSSTDFKLGCTFADKSATGGEEVNPDLVRNLKRNGFMYGFTMEDLNLEFMIPGKGQVKFQGLRGKFAVVKVISTGQSYRYEAPLIASMVRAARKA